MTDLIPDKMTNFLDLLRWANDLSGGVMLTGFLFVLLVIVYYIAGDRTSDRFLAGSLVTAVAATLFRAGQLINDQVVVTFWVIAGVAVMYSIWRKDN